MTAKGVEGFTLNDPDNERHGDVCQMIDCVSPGMSDEATSLLLDVGPSFYVKFHDGKIDVVPGVQLNPWFPV